MKKNDWNPEFYLQFDKERILPTIDLVHRISFENPAKVADIGCGPGNSTNILFKRWPNAQITGIDNSPGMIKKAKKDHPKIEWQLLDAGKEKIVGKYDILFSNATIQWIPNHTGLLKKFASVLNSNGVLAIQMPMFWDMPLGKLIAEIAQKDKWQAQFEGVAELFTIHDTPFYYDILSKLFQKVEMWETKYMHIMGSHQDIYDMIASTGLRPFFAKLSGDEIDIFKNEILQRIKEEYPARPNGKVIFPFFRLFFVAQK